MSKPWFPFYVGDFLRDTLDMNSEEIGAYVLLICHYWANGSLPIDDRRLSTIARIPLDRWGSICSSLAARFDRNWRHKRIDEELVKTEELSLKRALAGSKALKTNAKNKGAIARQMLKISYHNSSHNHNHSKDLSTSLARPLGPLSIEALESVGIRGTSGDD